MLSKNIVKKSVKSTSETTNKIFLKKKRNTSIQTLWCHIFPRLRNTPHQIPEVDLQNASPDDFQKPKMESRKKKVPNLEIIIGETNSKV